MNRIHVPCKLAVLVLTVVAVGCGAGSTPAARTSSDRSALSITGLFSTGVDANGAALANGATDPHYTLTSNDAAHNGPAAIAIVPAQNTWAADTSGSTWIGTGTNAAGGNGKNFIYTTTFVLADVDPADATLSGSWACDDTCTLSLNGTQVASKTGGSAWTTLTTFTVPAGSPFVLGTNTLAFKVSNSGGGITGIQVRTLSIAGVTCSDDSGCSASQYCNTASSTCVAKLPNGDPIPTVSGHDPVLDGTCNPDAGAAVCASGVCDANDDACGYANGDGTCTQANAAQVCRSGACSAEGICAKACTGDLGCPDGWCDKSLGACEAKLPNGSAIPTDPGHSPTLNGNCTAGAALLVCQSGVCDSDDDACGYPDGTGPCTAIDPSRCRSGACSLDGTCEPSGGCHVDLDCAGGHWCDGASCHAKVANGDPIPTAAGHAPPLDGSCTVASASVCESGVCDSDDDKCGYADGDGPCTTIDPTACRSGACSLDGTCEPTGGCHVNLDCGSGEHCDVPSQTCVGNAASSSSGGSASGSSSGASSGATGSTGQSASSTGSTGQAAGSNGTNGTSGSTGASASGTSGSGGSSAGGSSGTGASGSAAAGGGAGAGGSNGSTLGTLAGGGCSSGPGGSADPLALMGMFGAALLLRRRRAQV